MKQITDNFRQQGLRKQLIKTLEGKGIQNPQVLQAINQIPRHIFFDSAFLEHAYEDKAFPIGEGQTISQPYTVARQTELLELAPGKKVLEIGTGSGYQAAVLLSLNVKLYTIEFIPSLHKRARAALHAMGFQANFILGDGSNGWPAYAPYDGIIVTAGAPAVPDALLTQLAIGGKLVIPLGDREKQTMVRFTRVEDQKVIREDFGDFRFVPLVGKGGWQS
jgi:protein-L-isoaspartate(D-aspartate) O-methyltransferase